MRDIASEVGMEAASLYSHVQAKEELLQAICFTMAEQFMKSMSETINDENLTSMDKIKLVIERHVDIITANISASAVFWNDWKFLSEPARSKFVSMQREYEQEFRKLLEQAISEGYLCSVNISFAVMAIFSSLNGIHKWPSYTMEPKALGEAFSDMFLKGMLIHKS